MDRVGRRQDTPAGTFIDKILGAQLSLPELRRNRHMRSQSVMHENELSAAVWQGRQMAGSPSSRVTFPDDGPDLAQKHDAHEHYLDAHEHDLDAHEHDHEGLDHEDDIEHEREAAPSLSF